MRHSSIMRWNVLSPYGDGIAPVEIKQASRTISCHAAVSIYKNNFYIGSGSCILRASMEGFSIF
jgi:hypothetical protein